MTNTAARPVSRLWGIAADLARVATGVAALAAAISQQIEGTVRFALLFALLLVPRAARIAAPFDAAFGWTLLLATVATPAGWYTSLSWIDWVIHCVTTGAVAAMAILVLIVTGIMRDPSGLRSLRRRMALVLATVAAGLAVGVVWEFYEWIATSVFGVPMVVGYDDTVADLAMDGLGSLLAGIALTVWKTRGHAAEHDPAARPRSR
ncbi:hypothetical protein Ppa06_69550 [Planomonospora parontospora subsp. parontospora]|uniref:Uncharacterized protein n=2 Tax=Planomonospora parontospora TaxID=58119 RepID=A0AA37BMJ2_9ACTN|nr:hypothetical protein [Planomonospora parontospora]GGK91901.1 hypothetical protein GCM10010126_59090 [Planomonospora parontospora]GII13157.1 hypothetical protein Ppa06_69550 [Planomonospora parontospora subsp. parontospora]